ncbi:MAG: RluA family pseudouridine synthase [Pirellulales bacterium]|nr:RluA family pseudouridine synthase [Pirellulales bacterium]
MKHPPLEILHEDNHLLVLNKPAGLPTMGVAPDRESLLTLAKKYIKKRYHKPGNVYLGILSRLDAPVTGVVLLARTSKAARRLTEQFRNRTVEKTYWALVEGIDLPPEGRCEDWLAHDERHRRMHIVGPTFTGAQQARLAYRRLAAFDDCTLLEISLETGRKHQIRIQLATWGHAILGDRKYGSTHPWPSGIALHARRLRITHPVGGNPVEFEAPVPPPWRRFTLPS